MTSPLTTERIVIVGAGLAALYAALELAPRPVLMISPEPLGLGASSAWAQGGVAAAMASSDTPEAHASDTLTAGAGTVDPEVAEMVTQMARRHILDLTALGAPFDRDIDGNYVMSREAAHSAARVVRVKGDQAGYQIMETLIEAVRATPSIQVLEGTEALRLETHPGPNTETDTVNEIKTVTGVWIRRSDAATQPVLIRCPGVLLAGGGSGGLYAHTTNPPRIRGQVIGLAARAGARIADAEFVQFHPTAVDCGEDPAPLATEALRGEGATLINADGVRFMRDLHPDAELAPRDIVARAIFAETQAGRRPMLDTRAALGAEVLLRFPALAETCARAGIDPVTQAIPVAVAAHYHMGGIETDLHGRASLSGLWVSGEAASTGLHGANRLASNGLLEALVYARRAAADIAATLAPAASEGPSERTPELHPSFATGGSEMDAVAVQRLRQTMTDQVGMRRDEAGLQQALTILSDLETTRADDEAFLNMCATATLITASALLRRESRGGHFRDDFPQPDPAFAQRSHITLSEARAIQTRIVHSARPPQKAAQKDTL